MSVYGRAHTHGVPVTGGPEKADDDWDTDPDYVNDLPEKDTRWGSKIIQPEKGSALKNAPDLTTFAKQVQEQDQQALQEEYQAKRSLYGQKKENDEDNN